MKFGLFLMPEPFPWSNWTLSYDLKLEEIVYAERFGYDEVWVGEHHTGAYENIPAPDIFIAKASALTQPHRASAPARSTCRTTTRSWSPSAWRSSTTSPTAA